MRLVRIERRGASQWGQVEGDTIHLTRGMGGERTGETVPLEGTQLLAPAEPTKLVCVGRNYLDHIRELGNLLPDNSLPTEPGIFLKGPNALAEPGGTVEYPGWTQNFHFEGELALVIGQRARHLKPDAALSAVLGYTCGLDLTARDLQKTDLQWFRAKAADRFCPLGPWIETDLDPTDLRVVTRVNGETRQDGRTSHMIFDVVQILTYVTRFVTLEPGDVVLTGTPEGVGPLQRGDTVEVEVEGVGTLVTHIGGEGQRPVHTGG
ncbi:fumarylacetoacetate hydrolase family protein [Deinococcus planocerae]|uniref:fumarylacetoacetate hydrolase family protein n=1 Tax=Deinococcus planocerae TaxID=1737569 RepID=UPI000C7ECC59|nr:fumarylacetoacetate hydrolase family protein [Deinococcus planocerae]